MRSSMLAACIALVLLAGPVGAQRLPSQPADAPTAGAGERVLVDAVFWALPGPVSETCMQLPPGRMALTLRLENVGLAQPVRYRFAPYWYRAADSPSELTGWVTTDARTLEATLAGGRYCYEIVNEARPPETGDDDAAAPAQLVAVKMTLVPQ